MACVRASADAPNGWPKYPSRADARGGSGGGSYYSSGSGSGRHRYRR